MSEGARTGLAAGVLFVDDAERVLMLRTTYKDALEIPGGLVEEGESPRAACVRELTEELGLALALGPLLVVDWAPRTADGDKLMFVFDGGRLADDDLAGLRFADGEIAEAIFVPEAELDAVTVPRLAQRLRTALAARRAGGAVYLERGDPQS
ncbi:hypothetical protein GCM10010123_44620 [Pilimelia anulata]|uniref:Nudix hydrolase domain-containing protein n=1 Tax=Pilimelia anulata TaxID=53371 RepID=A0A8J3BBJ0_9ACTN|nr:NUDIX hydrolase [Pilimelia anulata]GGK09777.1 hypothetical protein GCM10010123_44620 [Pilimelia anulata]